MVSNHRRRHLLCRNASKYLICGALSDCRSRVGPDQRCRDPVITSGLRGQVCGTRPKLGLRAGSTAGTMWDLNGSGNSCARRDPGGKRGADLRASGDLGDTAIGQPGGSEPGNGSRRKEVETGAQDARKDVTWRRANRYKAFSSWRECGHCRLLMHQSRSGRDCSPSLGRACRCHTPLSDGRARNAGILQAAIRCRGQRSGSAVKLFLCTWAFRSQPALGSRSGRSRCENAHRCAGCPIIPSCSSLYIVANLCYRSLASGWRYSASLLCAIASSSDCGAASGLSESST